MSVKNFYNGKKVLVTGGTGLIGRPLVKFLAKLGAEVTVASLDTGVKLASGIKFIHADLRELSSCIECCEGQDFVFQLAGVKGSPKMCIEKPASFMVPTIQFSFNMMEAARRTGVERYLFTSSVGVYAPSHVFCEDDVWTTLPSNNDRFAGWAKRMGELQAEAYKIEYGWDKISIVRPANVYGPYDNFDPENAMVIPSLINRAIKAQSKLVVWGDGSAVRDFIFAEDVADGMLEAVAKGISEPINLGSGSGVSIKSLAQSIVANLPGEGIEIEWDKSKPTGDALRLMNTERAKSYGIHPKVSLDKGIRRTIEWYVNKKYENSGRYNSFTEFPSRTV